METCKITSEHEHPSLAFANILFATWLYSLLLGGGMTFARIMLIYVWQPQKLIILILGLATVFFSPILLGVNITRDWQRSIKAGFGSFLVCMLSFWMSWVGASNLYRWVQGQFNSFDSGALNDLLSLLFMGFITYSTIIAFILLIKVRQYQKTELGVSAIISMGLSLVIGMALNKSLPKSNEVFHVIWQTPSLVWISVVYFTELLAGRSKWTDFLVWAFLTLISFGLPYIVVFLLSVD